MKTFDANRLRLARSLQDKTKVRSRNTLPCHSRIDLDVHGECLLSQLLCGAIYLGDLFRAPHRRCEVVLNHDFAFSAPDSAHEKDASDNACLTQLKALVGACNSEPRGSCSLQRPSTLDGSMSVGITLHDRANRCVGSNEITNELVVVNESCERDLGPCGSRRHVFSLASRTF